MISTVLIKNIKGFSILFIGIFLFIYSPVFTGEFLSWDDKDYIINNLEVKDISFTGVVDFFTKPYLGNYHPVTMLAYSLQFYLFGANASGFHFVSALLHLINFLLVFWLANFLLKKKISAIIVASLFLLHPINIESVAWISEQKNLLYVLFLLLSLKFYFEYSESGEKKKYLFSILSFLLSALSKGQAVSLPIIILAVEFIKLDDFKLRKSIANKIPYFIISLLFGIIAIKSQNFDGYINESHNFNFLQKIFIYSYDFLFYFIKIIFPFDLKAYYPYLENIPFCYSLLGVLVLAVFGGAFYLNKKKKSRIYLGVLIIYTSCVGLIIQVIPLGEAMVAERYAYLPSVFICVFGVYFLGKHLSSEKAKAIIGILFICFFSCYTFSRVKVWKNDTVFFTDLLNKLPENEIVLNSSAANYMAQGKFEEAKNLLERAIAKDSNYFQAYFNLGLTRLKLNEIENAIIAFNKVESIQSDYFEATYYKGICFQKKGDYNQSIIEFTKTLEINKNHNESLLQRAIGYGKLNQFKSALIDLEVLTSRQYKPEMTYYLIGLSKFKLNTNGCADILTARNYGNPNADAVLAEYCK